MTQWRSSSDSTASTATSTCRPTPPERASARTSTRASGHRRHRTRAVDMRVAILDDWFDTLRTLPCFDKLSAHEVTVFHDHVEDVDLLASRLAAFEALVLIRERTEIRAPLLERLTRLR